MPIEILMPALSPTMTEGNLVKWSKKEGEKVKSGDVIAEIETDKATMELEASNSGTLGKIVVQEGAEAVAVGTLIAYLLKEGEDIQALNSVKTAPESSAAPKPTEAKPEERPEPAQAPTAKSEQSADISRVMASPLAKRIAEERAIDLAQISGTGPHGRVIKDDILNFKNAAASAPTHFVRAEGEKLIPHTSVRKVIAKRLLESKQNVPHFYLSLSILMDEALKIREQINNAFATQNIKASVNDLIIKASALALRDFPQVNASWQESGMLMYQNIDISVAVSTDSGLITPIVQNANAKSITQISVEMKDLAKRAKENKLKPHEFQGGGFSISNLGMFGIQNFNAIINPPQSCILAVGATTKAPYYCEKSCTFVPKNIMEVTISCDHRVVDGALGAQFLNKIKSYLENPISMLI